MPALPAAPQTLRVALSGTISLGLVWLTRFYITYTGTAPTNAQLATFDAAVLSAFNTNLRSLTDSDTVLTMIETMDLSSAVGAIDISPVSSAGTRAGGQLPGQVAFVTSYEIGRRYRGGHPRGYWRFGTITDVTNPNAWSAALVTAVNTGMAAFMTAVKAAGWTGAGTLTQSNVSYYKGFTVVTNPITGRARNVPTLRVAPTIDTVTSIVGRSSVGTQRRRENFIA